MAFSSSKPHSAKAGIPFESLQLFQLSKCMCAWSFIFIASIFLIGCKGSGSGSGANGNVDLAISMVHAGIFVIPPVMRPLENGSDPIVINVNNVGNSATNGNIVLTDTLPTGLFYAFPDGGAGTGAGWTCTSTSDNRTATCTYTGAIAPGAMTSVVLNVLGAVPGDFSDTATVSTTGDVNTANNSSTIPVMVRPYSFNLCGSPTGNEGILSGQYGFLLQGFAGSGAGTPVAIAGTFAADGHGNIAGGEEDFNEDQPSAIGFSITAPQHLAILSAGTSNGSLYGSYYTVGSDHRACMQLVYALDPTANPLTQPPMTVFRFALSGLSAGVASKGRVIEFDSDSSCSSPTPTCPTGLGLRVAGILRQQDATAFSLTQLKSNYALGGDGVDFAGHHVAIAGSTNVATGGIQYDLDEGGSSGANCAGQARITSLSATTGRGLLTFTPGCAFLTPAHEAVYVINANEIFFIQIDQFAAGIQFGGGSAMISGRAIATGFSSSSVSGNYILHMMGQTGGAAHVSLALLTLTPGGGNIGTVGGTLFTYSQSGGASTSAVMSGSYTVDTASGRVTFAGPGIGGLIAYLATPFDGVSAFVLGEPDDVSGAMEFQPTQTYTTVGVVGTYVTGTEDPGDNTVTDQSGIATLSSAGVISGTRDQSGPSGLTADQLISGVGPVSINSDGTGNFGVNTVAITNGTKLFFVDESGGPAVIGEFEK